MKKTVQFRQGDCLFVKIDKIPLSAKKTRNRIVARGEFSNHSHIITGECVVFEENGEFYIDATNASVEHLLESAWLEGQKTWTGEHHPIKLESGIYKMKVQREYDPYEKHIRTVQD